MTRDRSFYRLLEPSATRAMCVLTHDLVARMRASDAGARWSFQRLNDQFGQNVGFWFRSVDKAMSELDRLLRNRAAERAWPIIKDRDEPQAAKYLNAESCHLSEELSDASSDFALDLLCQAKISTKSEVIIAVLHLRRLTELIPKHNQASFLFHCWQHWTAELTPQRRAELLAAAKRQAAEVGHAASDLWWAEKAAQGSWRRYVDAIHRIIREPVAEAVPKGCLLFEHAHLTHNRLGIGVAQEAMAACIARSALLAPPPRRPAPALAVGSTSEGNVC